MKKTSMKSMAVAMVAVVAGSANAQNVVTGINTRDAQACGQYLTSHPADTIVNEFNLAKDGMRGKVTRSVYMQNGDLSVFNDTLWFKQEVVEVVPQATVKTLDSLSMVSRFVEEINNGRPRDVIYDYSSDAKAYRDAKNGDTSDTHAGKIVQKAANKYGWGVVGGLGYSVAKGVNGPIANAGVEYDREWWALYLIGEGRKSKHSQNAVNAGENYWTFSAESALMIRPFQLDEYDQNRVFVFGGVGFENYATDSAPVINEAGQASFLRSRGNYLYATFGVAYEYRFFATGNSLGARLQWRNTRATVQNSSDENFGSIALSVYFKFGFHRNNVSTK